MPGTDELPGELQWQGNGEGTSVSVRDYMNQKPQPIPTYYEDNGRSRWPSGGQMYDREFEYEPNSWIAEHFDNTQSYDPVGLHERWDERGAGMEVPEEGYSFDPSYRGHYHRKHRRRGEGQKQSSYEYEPNNVSKSVPHEPSLAYLTTSLELSRRKSISSRKLLILDLNGTLVYRSKPFIPLSRRFKHEAQGSEAPSSSQPPFKPSKRIIYSRPYLPSFREYIYHPSTRSWLDVMIWSSAQPHSVKSMLNHCFTNPKGTSKCQVQTTNGEESQPEDRFIAVWGRDTLGLSVFDYSRKTQTTKDLHKPWSQLTPMAHRNSESSGQPHEAQWEDPEEEYFFRHSAKTTILLDDSPLKARLQPWNHVCLQEYDAIARKADVKTLKSSWRKNSWTENEVESESSSLATAVGGETYTIGDPGAVLSKSSPAVFDSTLLAIIGILETIKYQSNIAGWIRSNGLWYKRDQESEALLTEGQSENGEISPASKAQGYSSPQGGTDTNPPSKRPFDDNPEIHGTKRRRLGSENAIISSLVNVHEQYSTYRDISSLQQVKQSENSIQEEQSDVNAVQMHSPAENQQRLSNTIKEPPNFWFNDAACFNYWVALGRDVLERLGIEEQHGVMPDDS